MTDNQVGAICAMLFGVAFIALVALRIWVDYKLELANKGKK